MILLAVTGCEHGSSTSLVIFDSVPSPFPILDEPIKSVQTYQVEEKLNVYSLHHDMHEEINIASRRINNMRKMLPGDWNIGTNLMGHYLKSKQVGNNDYVLMYPNIVPIVKQKGENLCWAACLQYIIWDKKRIVVDQNKLAEEISDKKASVYSPATLVEIVSALGLRGMRLSKNGAWHIMETLGWGHPLILGLQSEDGDSIGHALVIVGVRYAFTNKRNSFFLFTSKNPVVFSHMAVLDPGSGDQNPKWIPVQPIEDKIGFILSFEFIPGSKRGQVN